CSWPGKPQPLLVRRLVRACACDINTDKQLEIQMNLSLETYVLRITFFLPDKRTRNRIWRLQPASDFHGRRAGGLRSSERTKLWKKPCASSFCQCRILQQSYCSCSQLRAAALPTAQHGR